VASTTMEINAMRRGGKSKTRLFSPDEACKNPKA